VSFGAVRNDEDAWIDEVQFLKPPASNSRHRHSAEYFLKDHGVLTCISFQAETDVKNLLANEKRRRKKQTEQSRTRQRVTAVDIPSPAWIRLRYSKTLPSFRAVDGSFLPSFLI